MISSLRAPSGELDEEGLKISFQVGKMLSKQGTPAMFPEARALLEEVVTRLTSLRGCVPVVHATCR